MYELKAIYLKKKCCSLDKLHRLKTSLTKAMLWEICFEATEI